jgi:hypothetical protein
MSSTSVVLVAMFRRCLRRRIEFFGKSLKLDWWWWNPSGDGGDVVRTPDAGQLCCGRWPTVLHGEP